MRELSPEVDVILRYVSGHFDGEFEHATFFGAKWPSSFPDHLVK